VRDLLIVVSENVHHLRLRSAAKRNSQTNKALGLIIEVNAYKHPLVTSQ
jgi:hypothetical protein